MARGNRNKVIAGEAGIVLGVINRVDAGLKAAAADFKKFGNNFKTAGLGISAIGAGIVTPIAGITASFAAAGSQLNRISKQTGTAVEQLSMLKFASGQTGVAFEDTVGAIEEFNIRLGEATQDGTGPAVEALRKLGLRAEDLAKLPIPEAMGRIGDALNQLSSDSDRQFLADEIFGGDAFKVMTLLRQGSEGINALATEAENLGVVMRTADAENASKLAQSMNRISSAAGSMKNAIGAALAPVIADILEKFIVASRGLRQFISDNRQVFVIVAAVGAGLVAFGTALAGAGFLITGIGAALGALASAIAFLVSPIGLVIAGIGVLGAAVFKFTNFFGDALAWMTERFGPLVQMIKDFGTVLFDALSSGDFAKAWDVVVTALEATWLDLTMGIRGAWNSTLDWLTDLTVSFAKGIGSVFEALGRGIVSLLDGYRNIYNSIFNELTERFGEATGVRTVGGPVDAFGAQFGGIDKKIRDAAEGLQGFGKAMGQAAQQRGDEAKKRRADRAKEAQERLAGLRKGAAEEAKAIRERGEMAGLGELPKLATELLGQVDDSGGTSQRGTFSSVGALFMGGAISPMERTARANETQVKQNDELIREAKKPKLGVVGE